MASPGWAQATPRFTSRSMMADCRGVDVAAVGLALLDHLGVAGDDLHPGRGGRVPHGLGDPAQVGDREALLEDEPGRQVQRRGAGHGQVVDRAVDGQVADVAAGEEQRRDHVGVGGERQPGAVDPQLRGVLERLEQRVAEGVEEDRLDQGVRRLAAGAVRHRDAFFPDPGAAPPGAVDAVQDLLLPVRQRQLAPAPGSGRVRLFVLGMLAERLVDPARLAVHPVTDLAGGHDRPTSAASGTRVRFIRPKL